MQNINILIAIDNAIIGLDVKKQLNEYGYNTEKMNPASKEKIREALGKGYQLMILEDSMNIESLEYAVQSAREYNLPTIYLTTDNETKKIEKDKFRILMMPFGKDDLREIVKNTLRDNLKNAFGTAAI